MMYVVFPKEELPTNMYYIILIISSTLVFYPIPVGRNYWLGFDIFEIIKTLKLLTLYILRSISSMYGKQNRIFVWYY